MALIFPRIARNFVKNGYFPTDEASLTRIADALDASGPVRVIDPCCGEGAALAFLAAHLSELGAHADTYGVEIDEERAWHAKSVLGTVAHADVHDVRIAERSMGLLFLNPPYGDLLGDKAGTGDRKQGRERHEKIFCRRSFNLVQVGGTLVLVVPFYVLDAELCTLIARHFERVQVFMAPEQEFKQCVLFGVKRRPGHPDAEVVKRLQAFGQGVDQSELPAYWSNEPYPIPGPKPGDAFHFSVLRLDGRQLEAELASRLHRASLWPRFEQLMQRHNRSARRPLRAMTDWHLALALAAGQICGVVTSGDGRSLLIKGRTHKSKSVERQREQRGDEVVETQIHTDRFVTVIRGIELTPGPNLGQIVTIA